VVTLIVPLISLTGIVKITLNSLVLLGGSTSAQVANRFFVVGGVVATVHDHPPK
jgi:hypothetical protein